GARRRRSPAPGDLPARRVPARPGRAVPGADRRPPRGAPPRADPRGPGDGRMTWALTRATELLDDVVARDADRPVRPWMWGPALLGFALAEVERATGPRGYGAWLRRFADHHLAAGARPVSADTIAPALVTAEL